MRSGHWLAVLLLAVLWLLAGPARRAEADPLEDMRRRREVAEQQAKRDALKAFNRSWVMRLGIPALADRILDEEREKVEANADIREECRQRLMRLLRRSWADNWPGRLRLFVHLVELQIVQVPVHLVARQQLLVRARGQQPALVEQVDRVAGS